MTDSTEFFDTQFMPQSRMNELYAFAELRDGLVTSQEARTAGISDSVLIRLAQRGRLERVSRGVYRIAHYPVDRFSQYREAILWAKASQGPDTVAISHETALLLFGISDVNPARVHITVPVKTRFRRERPRWITIHHAGLVSGEIIEFEGIPVTSVERTIVDVLGTTKRVDIARSAIADGLKKGLLNRKEAKELTTLADRWAHTYPSKAPSKGADAS